MGPYNADGEDFFAGGTCKFHGEFSQCVLDVRDDALRQRGRHVLFGEDSDSAVGLGLEDFFLRSGPWV